MSFQYLQPKQNYEDRYDLHTIEQCLDQLKMLDGVGQKMKLEPTLKNYPDSELERNISLMRGRMLFLVQAQRYKYRTSRIAEWMEADKIKQEKQDNTPSPKVNCPNCGTSMIADGYHHLKDWDDEKIMRVLFTFDCPNCKKRQGVYDDGEIYVSKPDYCSKCGEEIKTTLKIKDDVTTFTTKCASCKYKKVDIHDHAKDKVERKANEKRDAELLAKYRGEFCLSEKEGGKYIETLEALEVGHEIYEETLAELDTPAHEKLLSINKISISELETLVNKALIKSGFTRLSFGNPDMDRYVLVPFTIQDSKQKRRDDESISDLSNLLKTTLKNTNWRVLKDAISYRLGFISGKLKGYESEKDLLKLFGKEKTEKPKSKFDPKLRTKYENHRLVQIQKMCAECEAKKRIRTRRLKNEPDGFFLNDGGRGYRCGICGESHDGEDIWWRSDGLRCRDCWKNIQEGVIPVFDLKKEWWEEEFFTKYEITSKHSVHPSSIKKLRREGVLVGRDLKDQNENIYETIYLVSENQKFLQTYQKQTKFD